MAMKLKRYGLIDPPSPFTDSLETWERHLAWAETLADDDAIKETTVREARQVVARKRHEKQTGVKSNLIYEPDPFYDPQDPESVSSTLATWERFLMVIEMFQDDEVLRKKGFLTEATIKRAHEMVEELRRVQAGKSS